MFLCRLEPKGWYWVWIWPYFLFNIDLLIQLKKNWNLVKSFRELTKLNSSVWDRIKVHCEFVKGQRRAANLKRDEALYESTPQFFLQLYAFTFYLNDQNVTDLYYGLQWTLWTRLALDLALASVNLVASIVATNYTYHR